MSLNIRLGKLAYLSACHTSTMCNFHLLDESINLSTALQLSGYSSVIGSLWKAMDSHAPDITRNIYMTMLKGGIFDSKRSAEALHHAVRNLRNETRRVRGFTRLVQND